MAERSRAKVNLVVDAVLARLRTIGDGDGWLCTPLTVKRLAGPGDAREPRPSLLVTGAKLANTVPQGPGSFESQVELQVGILLGGEDDPEEAIHNAAADVAKALSNGDVTFSGTVVGGLFVEGYESAVSGEENGEAMAVLTVKGLIHWEATAP